MSISTFALGVAGATVAVLSGVATYAATSTAPEPAGQVTATDQPSLKPRVRLRPCGPDAVLEKGVCVTRTVRTVVVGGGSAGAGQSTAPFATVRGGAVEEGRLDDDGDLVDDHGGLRDDDTDDDTFDDASNDTFDDTGTHGSDDSDDSDDSGDSGDSHDSHSGHGGGDDD